MKKNLKISILIVGLLVVALGFSSVNIMAVDVEDMPEKPDSLSFVAADEWRAYAQDSIEIFEEKYGIEVDQRILPYDDVWPEQTTQIRGRVPLDIMFMSNSWHPELGQQGMATPLGDFPNIITEDLLENYAEVGLNMMSSHGELWGLPVNPAMLWFVYNSEMLSELGYENPPETWEDVEEISEKAMDEGLAEHGILMGLAPLEGLMCYYDVFLKLYGGQWINDDQSEWVFNSDEAIEATEYMIHLIETGVIAEESLETRDRDSMHTFLAGNAPFHFNWTFIYNMAEDPDISSIVGQLENALVPNIKSEIPTYTVLGGGGWGISPTTEHPEWSAKLLTYIAGENTQRFMLDYSGAQNAWEPLLRDEELLEEYPLMEVYREMLDHGGFRPSDYLTWYSEFRDDVFLPRLHDALHGRRDAEEALNAAQEEAQQMLDNRGL